MEPGTVVEGLNIIEDRRAGFGAGRESAVVDDLVFEAAPKRLDEGIVVAVAFAAHGGDEPVLCKCAPERDAGKPRSPVAVGTGLAARPPAQIRAGGITALGSCRE